MTAVALVATLLDAPSPRGEDLVALPRTVGWLEVRADRVGDLDVDWLRNHFSGRLIYTLRSRAEGGEAADSPDARRRRILTAAKSYDLVTLEGDRDLTADLLAEIPPRQRLISWCGSSVELPALKARFAKLSEVEARFYKLVPTARASGDELVPLSLLKASGRSDLIAYAEGLVGFWSRMVAPSLGCPIVFGAVAQTAGVAGEPSISRLIDDYGLPAIMPVKEIYGIAGNPVSHSLSPRLHNAAYRALGHPALFVPFHVEAFNEFWREVVEGPVLKSLGMPIKGLTVASPHKEAALLTAKMATSIARDAESANLLVRNNGYWKADSTDPNVVFMANQERGVQMLGKRAAVIGCGGAGRAIAAALNQSGAGVTLVNRGPERGEYAAELLGLPYIPLKEFDAEGYNIVVNATPVGREDDDVPFELDQLDDDVVVIDLVYGAKPTPLVASTRARAQVVIDGRDVLVTQVMRQFQIMTGQIMPAALARETLGQPREPARVKADQLPQQQTTAALRTDAN
jgi:3-dehydroquinate dehydratase/shikimate dehydrogenase